MSEEKIYLALRKGFLTAIPAATNITAFENQTFDPAGKAVWYQFNQLPNAPDVATLGTAGQDAFAGFIQVDINLPLNRGREAVGTFVAAMRAYFVAGRRLLEPPINVIVSRCGQTGPARKVGEWFRVSVAVYYETRINRNADYVDDTIEGGDADSVFQSEIEGGDA